MCQLGIRASAPPTITLSSHPPRLSLFPSGVPQKIAPTKQNASENCYAYVLTKTELLNDFPKRCRYQRREYTANMIKIIAIALTINSPAWYRREFPKRVFS